MKAFRFIYRRSSIYRIKRSYPGWHLPAQDITNKVIYRSKCRQKCTTALTIWTVKCDQRAYSSPINSN